MLKKNKLILEIENMMVMNKDKSRASRYGTVIKI